MPWLNEYECLSVVGMHQAGWKQNDVPRHFSVHQSNIKELWKPY